MGKKTVDAFAVTLGATLRRLRDARGLTQEEAARQAGFPHAKMFSLWENGRMRIHADDLARLIDLYGASLERVLQGTRRRRKAKDADGADAPDGR